MVRLIQGFFFQPRPTATVKLNMLFEVLTVPIEYGMFQFMYSGVIFPNPENKTELIGEMTDEFGKAKLFDIEITEDEARFTKKYSNRPDTINYCFKKDGTHWVGKYSGIATGEGDAKCVITEADDSLFCH